jgi:adenylate cyclase
VDHHSPRKLAAIMALDVVGYSRLMNEDEAGTLSALKTHWKELVNPKIAEHDGRVVKLMGDGALVEFPSVVEAAQCAVEIQRAMALRNASVPADWRMEFRIGINIGDIIIEGDDIYGDGVNVAERLQSLAEPGGICVRRDVRDEVRDKLPLSFVDLGEQSIKNIARPVRLFSVKLDTLNPADKLRSATLPAKNANRSWRGPASIVSALLIAAGLALWLDPWEPEGVVESAKIERMAFPLPEKPSIAVLPFDNLSGDSEQEYFADGMTDDLITALSKISGLFIIARHSVFTYKGKPAKVQEVAEELGVRYVVEGSVRRDAGRIRINAQLIDATTGGHVWAERYDRDYENVFALQDEITQSIASALSIHLSEGEKARLAGRYTDNLDAYEYYLRGEQTLHSFSISYPEELNTALLMYEEAITRDSNFARAYVGHALASYYVWRVAYVIPTRSIIEARENARESVIRALALDASLPRAYAVLAQLQLADGRYDEAIAAAANAVAMDPNNAESYVVQALVLTKAGRNRDAIESMAKAYRLNPKPPPHYDLFLGKIQFDDRNYAAAVERLENGLRGQPRASLFHWYLAPAYAYLGRLDKAKTEIAEILGFVPYENLMRLRRIGLYKFKRDVEHYAEGFRLAGVPELPYGSEGSAQDPLTGAEARELLFGRSITITDLNSFQQFLVDRTGDGKLTIRGPLGSDVGTSTIDGDMVCDRLRALGFRSSCGFVFRNPDAPVVQGTAYRLVSDNGVFGFSISD